MTHLRFPDRSVVAVMGDDATALLERLITARVDDMAEGVVRCGALLTPQGKIIADFLIQRIVGGYRLDVASSAAADLIKRLNLFKLRAQVEIGLLEDWTVCMGTGGWPDPRGALPDRAFVPATEAGEVWPDWHAHRIGAGIAAFGKDFFSSEVFPADINMDLIGGIDFKKGCFVGQEVVSRMKRRGTARRRTLVFETAGTLAPGTALKADTSTVGEVTSSVDGLALARVRIDRLAKADAVTAEGAPVTLRRPDWLDVEIQALGAGA